MVTLSSAVPTTFESLQSLDDAALRELLTDGDARTRLWAIWALALRRSGAVADHVAHEPSPGVRRHLCLVLAEGELDILVAVARHDPDEGVRATAAGILTTLALGGRVPWDVVFDRLDDASPRVATAVFRALAVPNADALPPRVELLASEAIRRADPDLRLAAIEALFGFRSSEAIRAIAKRLEIAEAAEVSAIVLRWLEHAGSAGAVHDALRGAAVGARLAAVRALARRWDDVACVADDDASEVVDAVRTAFAAKLEEVPLVRLAQWLEAPGATTPPSITYEIARRLHSVEGAALPVDRRRGLSRTSSKLLDEIERSLRARGVDLAAIDARTAEHDVGDWEASIDARQDVLSDVEDAFGINGLCFRETLRDLVNWCELTPGARPRE